ncbi:hypothetical protein OTU49_000346 [Cherax quadricarinatus]|uniref:BZIP domain-containing protein n=1 Tax=Cherax quadricarinatus TaxID=27406 RepID=A0AAW0Y0W2_CHEQU
MKWCAGTGKGAPILDQMGAPSGSRAVAGTWIQNKFLQPKLMVKQSGFGDFKPFMDVGESVISGSSSDLNTPEIKFEEMFSGTHTYSYSDCSNEVETETAQPAGPPDVFSQAVNSKPYFPSTAIFDLSLSPAGCTLQTDQVDNSFELEEEVTTQGCVSVTDSSCLMPTTYEQNLGRPQPQPSPSDFLSNSEIYPGIQMNRSSTNQQAIENHVSSLDVNDCEFKFPQDILDQMDNLFPDVTLVESDNLSSTELDMYLVSHERDDLLHGVLDESGILQDETFHRLRPSSEADVCIEPELPTEGAKNIFQANIQQHQYSSQNQTVCFESGWPTMEELPMHLPSVERDPVSSALKEEGVEGFETLVKSLTPVSAVRSETTATSIGPVRVTRQRRNSRKPLRFRDTISCDDPGIALDLEIPVIPEEPLATTSGYTTKRGRKALADLTEEEKYHRIRTLNNMASKRCRQKRKATIKEMEEELIVLTKRNQELKEKELKMIALKEKVQAFVNRFFQQKLALNNA